MTDSTLTGILTLLFVLAALGAAGIVATVRALRDAPRPVPVDPSRVRRPHD